MILKHDNKFCSGRNQQCKNTFESKKCWIIEIRDIGQLHYKLNTVFSGVFPAPVYSTQKVKLTNNCCLDNIYPTPMFHAADL